MLLQNLPKLRYNTSILQCYRELHFLLEQRERFKRTGEDERGYKRMKEDIRGLERI